jgi:AcrR family transcriptional regulator
MSPRRAKAVVDRVGDDPATALREHLIDAADRLIAQTPITTITTRDIARAAGVSDGVLYNYFADKNDLLVAALLRQYRRLVDDFQELVPVPGTGTVEENLASLGSALFALESEFVPMIAGFLVDPILFHRMFAAIHEEPFGIEQLRAPVTDYLEGEQALGRIAPDVDRTAVTVLLMGSTSVMALASQMLPPALAGGGPDVRAAVNALVRGLRPDS